MSLYARYLFRRRARAVFEFALDALLLVTAVGAALVVYAVYAMLAQGCGA